MRVRVIALFIALLVLSPLSVVASQGPQEDGLYAIDVSLTGGSGRASVHSPALLTIAGGISKAEIVWSSPHYEYMVVDGVYYYPLPDRKTSTFEIPIVMDQDMPISAQTLAMSQPHEIDYTLHFDSGSITKATTMTSRIHLSPLIIVTFVIVAVQYIRI